VSQTHLVASAVRTPRAPEGSLVEGVFHLYERDHLALGVGVVGALVGLVAMRSFLLSAL
jgi:hypothetical protein